MRWLIKLMLVVMITLPLMTGCAYEQAYIQYANAQAAMAQASGPLFKQTLTPDGKVASFEVGNPMVPMAMMQMKQPKSEWESFFDFLKFATPFAAIWGVAGALSNSNHGNTTNVSGNSNAVGNTAGQSGLFASPVTTTTTTTTTEISGMAE